MITDDTMQGIISAMQQDCEENMPECGHAACIVLRVFGVPADEAEFPPTGVALNIMHWIDLEITELLSDIADLPLDAEDELRCVLAIFFTKGVMMGKKLGLADVQA